MRILISALVCLPFSLPGQTAGTCAKLFETPAGPAHDIKMDLRAGDIEIVGSDNPRMRVSCTVNRGNPNDVRISFAADHLTTRGGSNDSAHFRIEIPRLTNLLIHCPAGNLSVSGVVGDKDVNLNAGNLTIQVGNAADYRHVEASVMAGDLHAPAFGASKDGLLRNFKKENATGKYRLSAALLAGDLTLK